MQVLQENPNYLKKIIKKKKFKISAHSSEGHTSLMLEKYDILFIANTLL